MVHMPLEASDCLTRTRPVPPRLQPRPPLRMTESVGPSDDEGLLHDEMTEDLAEMPGGAETADKGNLARMTIKPMSTLRRLRRMVLVPSPNSPNPQGSQETMADTQLEAVTLNLYKLGVPGSCSAQVFNTVLSVADVSAFHCGVELYGREWSFQASMDGGSGVFCCMPKKCHNVTYSESVQLGSTPFSHETVNRLIGVLRREWQGSSYDLLKRNCCHFCEFLCQRLKVGRLPEYITSATTFLLQMKERQATCSRALTEHHFCGPSGGCMMAGSDSDEYLEALPALTNAVPDDAPAVRRLQKQTL